MTLNARPSLAEEDLQSVQEAAFGSLHEDMPEINDSIARGILFPRDDGDRQALLDELEEYPRA